MWKCRNKSRRFLAAGVSVGLAVAAVGVAMATGLWLVADAPWAGEARAIPSYAAVRANHRASEAVLLDRHGKPLQERRVDSTVRRLAWVELERISPSLREAVIRAEDRRFYRHGGVDLLALLRAASQWVRGDRSRGGSTIPMQLVGMLDAAPRVAGQRRDWRQKLRQMTQAWALERAWSKTEILEAYLNRVGFRGELQGVAAASAVMFGKLPHGLSTAESCALAGLVRSPNAQAEVLLRRARGVCEPVEEVALRQAIAAAIGPGHAAERPELAPHLGRLLLEERSDRGGREPSPSGQSAEVGFSVAAAARSWKQSARAASDRQDDASSFTSLDAEVQRVALRSLRENLLALRQRNVHDGAVLVVDNATGEVLAYVGGAGAAASSAVYVDGVRARRQAGSTLKPFLYAQAFDLRLLTAASALEDTPLEIAVGGGLYRPRNYDDTYRGWVTPRVALAGSLNVPAVRTLELLGADTFVRQLRELGFAGIDSDGSFYGPSLALGSAEVSLWELVNAYRTLANGGVWSRLRFDRGGTREEQAGDGAPASDARPVLRSQAAFLVSDILRDRDSRAATFGVESVLATPYWSAVKTGTSKEMRDNWCLGFSSRYSVGVWVGNLDGEPMHGVSGVAGAAPVWREVMDWLHEDPHLAMPPTVPAHGLERQAGEWFLEGTQPPLADKDPGPARILQPVHGSILGLDPDIPASLQRVVLRAQGAGPGWRWRLGESDLGDAREPILWQPLAGRHQLRLVDARSHVVDRVEVEVRGHTPRSASRRDGGAERAVPDMGEEGGPLGGGEG